MSEIPSSPELPPSPDRGELLRLVGLAVFLPAVVAAANYVLAAPLADGRASPSLICVQVAWYIAQVGIVGALVGRGLRQPVWCGCLKGRCRRRLRDEIRDSSKTV